MTRNRWIVLALVLAIGILIALFWPLKILSIELELPPAAASQP